MRDRRLLLLVALALVVRLAVVVQTPGYAPRGDAADYDRHAAALVAFGTYPPTLLAAPGGPTALRPPAYPYLLAATYRVTGGRFTPGRLVGALLGTLAVALAALIALSLFGLSVARWTAGLGALFAPMALLPGALLAENLFVPTVLGAVAAVLALRRTGAWPWALLAGVLCGVAALTRSNGIVVAVAVGFGAWTVGSGRARLRAPALVVGATLVLLAPWAVRNLSAFGGQAPLGTQAGYTLAGMYNAEAARGGPLLAAWRTPDSLAAFRERFHRPGTDEGELDGRLRRDALRFAAHHPLYVAQANGLGALRLFDVGPGHATLSSTSYAEEGIDPAARGTLRLELYVVVALAVAGAVVLVRRRGWGPAFVWLTALLLALSVLPTSGTPRYRAPIDPFLVILAAVAVVAFRGRRADRRARA